MKTANIIALFLALVLALSLAACSDNNVNTGENETAPPASPTQDNAGNNVTDDTQLQSDEAQQYEEDALEIYAPDEDLSLSSVLYDFSFTVEGDSITLPLTLDEFMAYGWEPSLELSEKMSGKTMSVAGLVKNGKDITVSLANMGDESLPIQECTVYGVSSYYYDDYMGDDENDSFAVIELPKGIILGTSTIEEVFNAYGGPSTAYYTNDTELMQTIVYKFNNDDLRGETRDIAFGVEIMTDKRKGDVITRIDIYNVDAK